MTSHRDSDSASYSDDSEQVSSSVLSDPLAILQSGMIVAKKYKLVEPLGEGGCSVTWAAVKADMKEVALKFTDDGNKGMWENEIDILHGLRNSTITEMLDCGIHDQLPFIVMPVYAGSVQDILAMRDGHPLTTSSIQKILREATTILAEIHEKGYIHRDVKVGNLFLTQPYGDMKKMLLRLGDFGISHRFRDEEGQELVCSKDYPFHLLNYCSIAAYDNKAYSPIDDHLMLAFTMWPMNGVVMSQFDGDSAKEYKCKLVNEPSAHLPSHLMWALAYFNGVSNAYADHDSNVEEIIEGISDIIRDTDGNTDILLGEDNHGPQLF